MYFYLRIKKLGWKKSGLLFLCGRFCKENPPKPDVGIRGIFSYASVSNFPGSEEAYSSIPGRT